MLWRAPARGLPPHNTPCTSQRIRGDESADRPYSWPPYSWPFKYPLYIVLVWNKLQSVYCSVPDYISLFRSFHNVSSQGMERIYLFSPCWEFRGIRIFSIKMTLRTSHATECTEFFSPFCRLPYAELLSSDSKSMVLKGTVSWDRFQKFWLKFTELDLTKGRGWFLNSLWALMIL